MARDGRITITDERMTRFWIMLPQAVDHVLATFKPDERELADEMVAVGADAAERWLHDGIDEAMNAYNGVEVD